MESYAQYKIMLPPQVATLVINQLENYHSMMMAPIQLCDMPQEFRVENVITIERLKFIKGFDYRVVQNPNFVRVEPLIFGGEKFAPQRTSPDSLHEELVEITIDVWQYVDL